MNAPGGGGDAGGSLPACVERSVLRTTWTILDATCVENVLVRTGNMVEIKKKKSGAFHKGPDPYIKRT